MRLTNLLLRKLFADPRAVQWVDVGGPDGRTLPGVGVRRADVPAGV